MFKKIFKKSSKKNESVKTEAQSYNGFDTYVEYIANTYGDGDVAFYESCFLY